MNRTTVPRCTAPTARLPHKNQQKDAPMTIYDYVRCSTDKQTVMQQVDALKAYGCDRIFRDKAASAAGTQRRKGLLALKRALKPGDTFVVTAIDRGFRCTLDAEDPRGSRTEVARVRAHAQTCP